MIIIHLYVRLGCICIAILTNKHKEQIIYSDISYSVAAVKLFALNIPIWYLKGCFLESTDPKDIISEKKIQTKQVA